MALGLQLGFWSLLISHITFVCPVVITIYAQLKGLDRNLVEAAQDLGASESALVRLVILPLCAPPSAQAGYCSPLTG